jgi:hypothetical protein
MQGDGEDHDPVTDTAARSGRDGLAAFQKHHGYGPELIVRYCVLPANSSVANRTESAVSMSDVERFASRSAIGAIAPDGGSGAG